MCAGGGVCASVCACLCVDGFCDCLNMVVYAGAFRCLSLYVSLCVFVLVGVFAGNVCSFGYMSMTIYAFVLPQAMCVCTLCINLQVF